jgi:hypothetical protein
VFFVLETFGDALEGDFYVFLNFGGSVDKILADFVSGLVFLEEVRLELGDFFVEHFDFPFVVFVGVLNFFLEFVEFVEGKGRVGGGCFWGEGSIVFS